MEFLGDQDRVTETVDVFWFINHYETYCQENDIPTDQWLYL